jgi:hypothetical protein
MTKTKRYLCGVGVAGIALALLGSTAWALTKDEQKCIDQYNNKLRLVSQQAGKSARACIKNAGKGKEADPDNCILTNPDGKIAGKEAKVTALYGTKCTGAEPIQQSAATGNAAHRGAIEDLAHDIFGDPVSGVVNPGKDEAKCQDKAIQRATQAFTEKMKNFRKCKKDNMKTDVVVDSATLEATCMTPTIPDPKGKIAKKVNKLLDDINDKCAGLEAEFGTIFPGSCAASASTAALGACIEQHVECRVCEALNTADGTSRDCDLFDDGLANGSCVSLTNHTCVLDPTSDIKIHIAALPIPLTFALSGSLDIGAGGNFASCGIQTLDPIDISSIGTVCISPSGGCATGKRNCAGAGPALGIDAYSDGNRGACASNAACATTCATFCGADTVLTAQCTGHCTGDDSTCNLDSDCVTAGQGACNGPDPVGVHGGICQCSCINTAAHGASDPGDFQCNLGSNLVVETAAPCDGTDVTIPVGTTCIPVSTEEASALITHANFSTNTVPKPPDGPNDQTGAPIACATVDSSTTTGLTGVGAVNFFGSALGDLSVGLKSVCQ